MENHTAQAGYQEKGRPAVAEADTTNLINVSGHKQELDRTFSVWSICALSLTIDNAWFAGATALVLALYNGGGPGVLYGLIVASFFYLFVDASLAELASAIPSSASVYHWASVTAGPRWGLVCSWFAGWWSVFAWTFGSSFISLAGAEAIVACYSLFHPDYTPERWQIFIAYLGITWLTISMLLFGQRILAGMATAFGLVCLAIWLATLLTVAIMPGMAGGSGYATHSFVWKDWTNLTGYTSDGFVFLLGMLNGAFAIGTPEACTHCAEEVRNPKRNLPIGIFAQLATGFVTTFTLYIALLYAITSLDDVFNSQITALPLAAIYLQATSSTTATAVLLSLLVLDVVVTVPSVYLTASRMLWTLARDDAVPFSKYFARVDPRFKNPFRATVAEGILSTILGLIYIGNATAFAAFAGSFIILTTLSYLAAILPHLLTRRRNIKPGPFWMPDRIAYPVLIIAVAYMITFDVIWLFPFSLPTSAETMNYSVVMVGGLTIIVSFYYMWKKSRGYIGPRVLMGLEDDMVYESTIVHDK